jgi:tetratricopeptide (TPR) repeat protein
MPLSDGFNFDRDALAAFCDERLGVSQSSPAHSTYRQILEMLDNEPPPGLEGLKAAFAIGLKLIEADKAETRDNQYEHSLFLNGTALALVRWLRSNSNDPNDLRLLEGAVLNSCGIALRRLNRWEDALDAYTELAALMDDPANDSIEAISVLAMAHDGIGDV